MTNGCEDEREGLTAKPKRFIVRYNVEFSCVIEAASEQDAIDKAIDRTDDGWDQKSISQYEAEEED